MTLLAILVGFLFTSIVYIINYYILHLRKYKDINKLPGPSTIEIFREMFGSGTPHGIQDCLEFK